MLCGFVKTVDIVLEKHVWLVHIIGCEECRSKSNIYLTLRNSSKPLGYLDEWDVVICTHDNIRICVKRMCIR